MTNTNLWQCETKNHGEMQIINLIKPNCEIIEWDCNQDNDKHVYFLRIYNFSSLPRIILSLQHLKYLVLIEMKAKELPPVVYDLTKLHKLNIYYKDEELASRFHLKISSRLIKLQSLRELTFSNAIITSFPKEIKYLNNLQFFSTGDYRDNIFPDFSLSLQKLYFFSSTCLKKKSSQHSNHAIL